MVRGFFVAAVAALATFASADTCKDVKKADITKVHKRLGITYTKTNLAYWSRSNTDLKPSCVLAPKTAGQVADIIKILTQNDDTFAIKSGGHNPNNWFASVDGGPLISTENLNEVTLDKEKQTVRVGPGNRWEDVTGALKDSGYAVIGGRIGNVGVGGYLLGGGLSFMSAEHGWAANNILEYELVLANSSIINVNANNYPDIFMSLKGGGNNLGVVTSYTLQAYPQGKIWGGNIFFTANDDHTPALLAALRDFTEHYDDEKAGIILTAERTLGTLVDIWVMFLFYDGPEPPAGVFDAFTAVPHFKNTCKTWDNIDALMRNNNWAVLKGSVYTIGTETLPLPSKENGHIMQDLYDTWATTSNAAQSILGAVASIAFQPIPKRMARAARAKGGDLLDLDDEVDRIIIELDYSFLLSNDYDDIDKTMRDTYTNLAGVRDKYVAQGQLPQAYNPLFQNDAFYPQDVWGRMRPEKAALARRVRDQLDPTNFFKTRTAGFKMS